MSSSVPTIGLMCKLVAQVCGKSSDSVHADMQLVVDLCMDSLAMSELVLGIEEQYGVALDACGLSGVRTVGDMHALAVTCLGRDEP